MPYTTYINHTINYTTGVVLGSFCREIQEAGCCSQSARSIVPMFKRGNPILSLYKRGLMKEPTF